MSAYDSQKFNLFRLPLLWFLVAAICAQLFIALNGITSMAAPTVTVASAAPTSEVYGSPYAMQGAPIKVELPAPQAAVQQIVTKPKPASPASGPGQVIKRAAAPPGGIGVEAVIQFALSQVGKPYVWGATGPNSYDCSGLVMTAFSKIGIKLPRTTRTMVNAGKSVSKAAMQRGDIVFPQAGHVAIYLGDGMMVHSPQPGERVKVSKVYSFYTARRLV